jgi:trehalose/maltose transport system permease protein
MAVQTRRIESGATPLPLYLLVALFVILGAGALGILISNVNTTLALRDAGEAFGTTLLRFLNDYGLIVPLILVAVGVALIRMGIRLFNRELKAAAWAQQLLLWMLIAAVVLGVQALGKGFSANPQESSANLWLALALLVAIGALAAGYLWLGSNMHVFRGDESLAERSARVAWNLLVPTLIVLVLVAARPLEKTFIASLTDQRFASGEEATFVGLDNYARLLGVRFDTISCQRGEDGACLTDENGSLVFPRPRDVLDESYRELRYRDVATITLGDSQLLFSARDRDFVQSIGNTMYFTVVSVALELVLGLFIAMVVNSKFPGRGLMRAAMLVPWAIPTVVSARLWEMMLRDNQSGVVNHFFTNLIPILASSQAWLANSDLQIPALIAIDVWKTTPFMALILLAGLQVIPSDIYEAADVDGASKVRQFFSITIPMLRPTIAVALVFRTLDAVRVFDVFNVLLGRQKLSMATYNYETLVSSQELGYASTIGVVIFIIILIFAVTYVRILGVSAE